MEYSKNVFFQSFAVFEPCFAYEWDEPSHTNATHRGRSTSTTAASAVGEKLRTKIEGFLLQFAVLEPAKCLIKISSLFTSVQCCCIMSPLRFEFAHLAKKLHCFILHSRVLNVMQQGAKMNPF